MTDRSAVIPFCRRRAQRTLVVLLLLVAGLSGPPGPRSAAAPTPAIGQSANRADQFGLPLTGPAAVLTTFRPPTGRYGPGHRGVDLAGRAGQQVLAAGPGVVVFAGPLAGRGVVSVEHASGLRTTYEPVLATVARGQPVRRGSGLGTLQPGHPACAPAVCLHWGARLPDGRYLDPMSLITGLRVRLLPWVGS